MLHHSKWKTPNMTREDIYISELQYQQAQSWSEEWASGWVVSWTNSALLSVFFVTPVNIYMSCLAAPGNKTENSLKHTLHEPFHQWKACGPCRQGWIHDCCGLLVFENRREQDQYLLLFFFLLVLCSTTPFPSSRLSIFFPSCKTFYRRKLR